MNENQTPAQGYDDTIFRTLFESALDAIIIIDKDFRFADLNQAACELFEITRTAALNKTFIQFIPENQIKNFYLNFANFISGDGSVGELTIVNSSGLLRYVEFKTRTNFFPGLHLSIMRDITARKKMEEEKKNLEAQVRQTQKLEAVGYLASGVAHEINNPLMGVINFAQIIFDSLEDERLKDFAANIIEEGERISKIVSNLLKFARQDNESFAITSLNELIENTLDLVKQSIRKEQIILDVKIQDDLPVIKCKYQQLQQVILNIINNSRYFLGKKYPEADPNKKIHLSVSLCPGKENQYIRISIEDTGSGIPDELKERVFNPFFTTKPVNEGMGLGLSISYSIVKDHCGEMTVESEKDKFTRFSIDLPLVSDEI